MVSMKALRHKPSGWMILYYLGMAVVLLWALLKSAGVINTPEWLEIGVPAVAAVIGLYGIFKEILDRIHEVKLDVIVLRKDTERDISLLQADVHSLRNDFGRLEKKM